MLIQREKLLTGDRFCELGSGFGALAKLAANLGMEAVWIEIEQVLVDQANDLAVRFGNGAKFYCGSFIPHDTLDELDVDRGIQNVSVEEDDVCREVGVGIEDCVLCFCVSMAGRTDLL
ncbi:MAG: hypothetical protein CMM07_14490 [Rhodopirellula sp.]|nr:hypothetical protein [Rhodopirellula sp.]